MQARTHKTQCGFTLIELVMVMAIIALCAMIVAPELAGFARGRVLPNTGTQLIATLRWCRMRAVSDGVAYRLNLDPNAGTWWVTKDDGTTGLNFVEVDDEMAREYKLPEGITMSTPLKPIEDGLYIAFDPGGRMDVTSIRLQMGDNWVDIGCQTALSSYQVMEADQ